jgi:hypothetical protein
MCSSMVSHSSFDTDNVHGIDISQWECNSTMIAAVIVSLIATDSSPLKLAVLTLVLDIETHSMFHK